VRKILAAASLGWAVVCIDPHSDSLAWRALLHLIAEGHERRILFERLSSLDRVLGISGIRCSQAENPIERAAENEELVDHYTELFTRRSGQQSLSDSPLKEEGVRLGVAHMIDQNPRRPDSYFRYVFEPEHPKFTELLQGSTSEAIRFQFGKIASGATRVSQYASAKRLINATVGSIPYLARSRSSFDLGAFLNNRGVLLVEGGYSGVSDEARRTVMGGMILRTIQFIRTRRKASPRVLLVLDEATNAGLISQSGFECKAMAECQKWGLDFLTLVQQPNFPRDVSQQIFSNCVRHEYFLPRQQNWWARSCSGRRASS
jgi:hypothetical protein